MSLPIPTPNRRQFVRLSLALASAATAWSAHALDVPGPVVSTEWLQKNRADVTLLDVRANTRSFTQAPQFETDRKTGQKVLASFGGHIPDAVLVDSRSMRTDRVINGQKVRYMVPEQADFEKLARQWGVKQGRPVVIAAVGQDGNDFNDAARLYWQFKLYGLDNLAVLNGGTTAWLAEGREPSTAASAPPAGDWVAGAERTELLASSDDVARASASNGSTLLVDARPAAQYLGLSKRDYVYAFGHVPNARNVSSELLVTPEGDAARMLPRATYADLFRASGVDPQAPAITYCNSGHLAAGTWFVLSEVLGNRKARLYDGSMHQWTLEKRPMQSVARSD